MLLIWLIGAGSLLAQPATTNSAPRPLIKLGPAVSYIFNNGPTNRPLSGPDTNLVTKALSVRLGTNAGICFDTQGLTYAAGWVGGFLDMRKTSLIDSPNSSSPVFPIGDKLFRASEDPSPLSGRKFKGYYVSGDQVVLSYSVQGADILDLPGVEAVNGRPVLTRTLKVLHSSAPIELPMPVGIPISLADPWRLANLRTNDSQAFLVLPALSKPVLLRLGFGDSQPPSSPLTDPQSLTNGGPAHWNERVTTEGKLGAESGPYAVDTLTLPDMNPWNSWMRVTGLDFFEDGRCAVCTVSGDVWIASGIDESLKRLEWNRFATGLYEPLGLRIVKNQLYVLCRDRITRLHDLNGDGEADYYETFNSDWDVYPTYHAYAFDLQSDRGGNLYFALDGNMVNPFLPLHGSLIKVSADGAKLEEFARGFRAANGLGVGPNDEITCSDNQGHWTPASKISWIREGGFYGYGGDPRQPRFAAFQMEHPTTSYEPPLCWMPMNLDNSSGAQVWVTSDKWGLPRGSLLHTSYGKCSLIHVMFEDVDGQKQGGAWAFPLRFNTGIMRARFNPVDGQLYVAGMKGWQTAATRDGGLQRVRHTGKPLNQPVGLHAESGGIKISFGSALNPTTANDAANYSLAQWNYRWTSNYGSDSWSVADPNRKGEDQVEVKAARLLPDGKSVFLETDPLKPVMQMRIKFSLETADGQPLKQEIYNTINAVK